MGDKLHFLAVQADSGRLIKFRRLLFFVFVQENGVNVIFQRRMLSVVDGRRIRGVVPNAAVHVGVAHIVRNVMVHKAGQIGGSLLSLLSGLQTRETV